MNNVKKIFIVSACIINFAHAAESGSMWPDCEPQMFLLASLPPVSVVQQKFHWHDDTALATALLRKKRAAPAAGRRRRQPTTVQKEASVCDASAPVDRLSSQLVEELLSNLSTQKRNKWDDEKLQETAATLGMDAEKLGKALVFVRERTTWRKKEFMTLEQIEKAYRQYTDEATVRCNHDVLEGVFRLTGKTCAARAQELGVTYEELDAFREYLIHGPRLTQEWAREHIQLDPGVIRAFYQAKLDGLHQVCS